MIEDTNKSNYNNLKEETQSNNSNELNESNLNIATDSKKHSFNQLELAEINESKFTITESNTQSNKLLTTFLQ